MKVCIMCQKDVEGQQATPVREDRIIKTIRSIKTFFHMAQNNQLYVCEADMQKYIERRKSFEKSMLFASVFAGLIVILIVGALIISGHFDIWAVVSAIVIAIFILMLPLFKYFPAVERPISAAPAINVPPAKPSSAAQKAEIEERPKPKRKSKKS